MRIKNEEIYKLIAELWNAEACATDAREQAWCAESVYAEVRASGMTPDEALQGAVHAVCTVLAATVERSKLEAWLEADDGDEGDDGDEDYDDEDYDDEDDGDEEYDDEEEYAADDDDDVLVEED